MRAETSTRLLINKEGTPTNKQQILRSLFRICDPRGDRHGATTRESRLSRRLRISSTCFSFVSPDTPVLPSNLPRKQLGAEIEKILSNASTTKSTAEQHNNYERRAHLTAKVATGCLIVLRTMRITTIIGTESTAPGEERRRVTTRTRLANGGRRIHARLIFPYISYARIREE